MKNLLFLITILIATTSFLQSQVELMYDNDTYTDWQVFTANDLFAVRMSPDSPCKVLQMKFYVGVSEGGFTAKLFEWEGSEPGTEPVFQKSEAYAGDQWKEVEVTGDVTFNGDFVVGFKHFDPSAYLAFDGNLQTGRNWILDQSSDTWSEDNTRHFLIRAVVEYQTGVIEELEGTFLEMYPNPVSRELTIKTDVEAETLSVINFLGQVVYSQVVTQGIPKLDVSTLQKGIYFVRLDANGKSVTKKIVVQ